MLSEPRTVNGVTYTIGLPLRQLRGGSTGITYPSGRTVDYAFDAAGPGQRRSPPAFRRPDAARVVANVAYHPFGGVKSLHPRQRPDLHARHRPRRPHRLLHAGRAGLRHRLRRGEPHRVHHRDRQSAEHQHLRLRQPRPAYLGVAARGHDLRLQLRRGRATASTRKARQLRLQQHQQPPRLDHAGDRPGAQLHLRRQRLDHRRRAATPTSTTCAGAWCRRRAAIGATNYKVNALGQRIRKTNSLGDTVFHYDTQGKLIAETDPGGSAASARSSTSATSRWGWSNENPPCFALGLRRRRRARRAHGQHDLARERQRSTSRPARSRSKRMPPLRCRREPRRVLRQRRAMQTDTISPYQFDWTNVAAGTYAITAKAVDNNGAETTSAPRNVTVAARIQPPTVSLGPRRQRAAT